MSLILLQAHSNVCSQEEKLLWCHSSGGRFHLWTEAANGMNFFSHTFILCKQLGEHGQNNRIQSTVLLYDLFLLSSSSWRENDSWPSTLKLTDAQWIRIAEKQSFHWKLYILVLVPTDLIGLGLVLWGEFFQVHLLEFVWRLSIVKACHKKFEHELPLTKSRRICTRIQCHSLFITIFTACLLHRVHEFQWGADLITHKTSVFEKQAFPVQCHISLILIETG